MSNEMTTKFLLTLISDKVSDLKRHIKLLKKQDAECNTWKDECLNSLDGNLFWLKAKVEHRRDELLKASGEDPKTYEF